jgi:heat shock protein HslJ
VQISVIAIQRKPSSKSALRMGFSLACAMLISLTTAVTVCFGQPADPLPSWNDCFAKQAIIEFVGQVTDANSAHFVPATERVAVFDNDGTLWPENPLPFQLQFTLDELKRLAPTHPEFEDNPAIAAALRGDVQAIKADLMNSLQQLLAATHAGMTTEDFDQRVRDWLRTARHPRYDCRYTQVVYQPMLELLDYLRANDFKTFIVSGGGADFMRVWAEEVYGIPPEQTIGSVGAVHFEVRDGVPVLVKDAGIDFIDDKEAKPVAIHRFIGRRPIACFGNSDGDKAMLEWTTRGNRAGLGLIVHHTDSEREYEYDRAPKSSGKLVEALAEAPDRGWLVVDMAKDWKQLWPTRQSSITAQGTKIGWVIRQIDGKPTLAEASLTIEFAEDGAVSGTTGVNRFSGKAQIEGERITFGPLAMTRRAGSPQLMEQETQLMVGLEQTRRFRVGDDGWLELLNEDGNIVVRCSKLEDAN